MVIVLLVHFGKPDTVGFVRTLVHMPPTFRLD